MSICPICKNEILKTESVVVERIPGLAFHKFCYENRNEIYASGETRKTMDASEFGSADVGNEIFDSIFRAQEAIKKKQEDILSPYITETESEVVIIGSAVALTALGEILIQKAKMGKRLIATFTDGTNKPISIQLDTDLLDGIK